MGGGEKYLCIMAESLANVGGYDVFLLSDSRPLDPHALERYFSVSLDRVHVRYLSSLRIRKALAEANIAVVMTNYRSMGLPAETNVYILQIPYPAISAGTVLRNAFGGRLRNGAKDLFRLRLLSTCRKASAVLVYSEFVRSALLHHHRLATSVLSPPIDDFSSTLPKEQAILSVGRIFHGSYNDKRYDVLIDAFCTLCGRQQRAPWKYWIAGSCADDDASQAWLTELKARAAGYPVEFHVNVSHTTLAGLYGRASILWHAAGYGVDENHPERTEHFGMTPLEAMSARCIPLVVNAGGTRETVEDGVSGLFWSTTDELLDRTERLFRDPALCAALRQGGRDRFARFSRSSFTDALLSIFRTLVQQRG
jgi:glycosyltransferase involved in cell wall biosynthesis